VEELLAPAWVTVTDCPAMIRVVLRAVVDVFAATEKTTVPVPAPLVAEVKVIQLAVLLAVQVHVLADALTVSVTCTLPALMEIGVGTANVQVDALVFPF
jgi:hypothetical protein